jgi:hypothetical protein
MIVLSLYGIPGVGSEQSRTMRVFNTLSVRYIPYRDYIENVAMMHFVRSLTRIGEKSRVNP